MINKVEKLIQDYKRETDNLKKISILVLIKNELDMVAKEIAKKYKEEEDNNVYKPKCVSQI